MHDAFLLNGNLSLLGVSAFEFQVRISLISKSLACQVIADQTAIL